MIQPVNSGRSLVREIEGSDSPTPRLWWLGHSGFAIKFRKAILYVDPFLSDAYRDQPRAMTAPLRPSEIAHAGLILATHKHADHLDPCAVPAMIAASPRAKLVVPKSVGRHAHSIGVRYDRMVTTDSGLRVEYLDDRIYAVPSAHESLDYTPLGGYPYLGYLIRFGYYTIYHAGDCVPYAELADRLRPYNVTVALLPISGRHPDRPGNFEIPEAAQLAEDIGARWLVPMHYGMFAPGAAKENRFVEHMLGQRPSQQFKIFQCGEGWTIPSE
ncbi:MAG: MBL fold metallo-hydrolase [Bryobacteraceae bacterium]